MWKALDQGLSILVSTNNFYRHSKKQVVFKLVVRSQHLGMIIIQLCIESEANSYPILPMKCILYITQEYNIIYSFT